MKRFIFEVEDNTIKEISVLAENEKEAREKLEEYDIEREDEIEGDMKIAQAKLKIEEEI